MFCLRVWKGKRDKRFEKKKKMNEQREEIDNIERERF